MFSQLQNHKNFHTLAIPCASQIQLFPPNPLQPVICLLSLKFLFFLKKTFFLRFIYLWERERERAGEGQREKETENPKQTSGSELSAQSLMPGWNS